MPLQSSTHLQYKQKAQHKHLCIKNPLAQTLNGQMANSVLKCTLTYSSIKLIWYNNIRAKTKLTVEYLTLVILTEYTNRYIRSILTSDWNINCCKPTLLPYSVILMGAGQMLTVWACFLHKALSFLEKNGWPSRLVEQTAHTKQVSCQVNPRASRNLSPASMGKSQPWQLVPNRL